MPSRCPRLRSRSGGATGTEGHEVIARTALGSPPAETTADGPSPPAHPARRAVRRAPGRPGCPARREPDPPGTRRLFRLTDGLGRRGRGERRGSPRGGAEPGGGWRRGGRPLCGLPGVRRRPLRGLEVAGRTCRRSSRPVGAGLGRLAGAHRRVRGQPTVVSRSLARSPVVVAGRGLARPESWREVLSRDDVRFVDPVRSSAPAAALLALKAEPGSTGADVDSVMVPLAQRLGDDRDAPRDVTELALDPGGAAVLSEQQLLDLRAQGLGRDLDVRVPGTGTMVLDYPLVALTEGSVGVEAAEQLADRLASPDGAELLEVAGFRSADLEPLPRDRGAGQLDLLRAPGAEAVATTLRRWSVLTVPSRILGVFDVSGSMDEVAGGRTRVSLASEASAASMGMFADQSQVGMSAFSVGLGGPDRDYPGAGPDQAARRASRRREPATGARWCAGGAARPDLWRDGPLRHDPGRRSRRPGPLRRRGGQLRGAVDRRPEQGSGRPRAAPAAAHAARGARPRPARRSHRHRGRPRRGRRGAEPGIVAATGGRSYVARNPAAMGKVFESALLSR